MPFLLANWKIIAIGIAIAGTFYAGWHSNTVWQAYHLQKEEVKVIENLGKGQTEIVKFNTALDKEKRNVKDDCVSKPMPPGIVKLLH